MRNVMNFMNFSEIWNYDDPANLMHFSEIWIFWKFLLWIFDCQCTEFWKLIEWGDTVKVVMFVSLMMAFSARISFSFCFVFYSLCPHRKCHCQWLVHWLSSSPYHIACQFLPNFGDWDFIFWKKKHFHVVVQWLS